MVRKSDKLQPPAGKIISHDGFYYAIKAHVLRILDVVYSILNYSQRPECANAAAMVLGVADVNAATWTSANFSSWASTAVALSVAAGSNV